MRQDVKNVEKDMENKRNLMNEPFWVIVFVLIIMGFVFGCLEYKFGNKDVGRWILSLSVICSAPLWMIAKALMSGDNQ